MGMSELMDGGLFARVIEATWQGSLLAVCVLALQWALRKRLPARWSYGLWGLVVVRLLLPVLPQSPTSMYALFKGMEAQVPPVAQAGSEQAPEESPMVISADGGELGAPILSGSPSAIPAFGLTELNRSYRSRGLPRRMVTSGFLFVKRKDLEFHLTTATPGRPTGGSRLRPRAICRRSPKHSHRAMARGSRCPCDPSSGWREES